MKKVILLVGLMCLFAVPSCKKGDEDPALSLLTRKARLTGNWEVESYNMNREYYNLNELQSKSSVLYNGSTMHEETEQFAWGTFNCDKIFSQYSFSFNKDGTWERVMEYSYELEDNYQFWETRFRSGNKYEFSSGSWAFQGKSQGTYKNKERLVLTLLVDSIAYTNRTYLTDDHDPSTLNESGSIDDYFTSDHLLSGQKMEVYHILRLANDELKLELGSDFSQFTLAEKERYGDCFLEEFELKKK